MAIINTFSSTTEVIVAAPGDTWITEEGSTLSSDTDGFEIAGFSDITYFMDGAIFAEDNGINNTGASNDIDIVIGAQGSIFAAGIGINMPVVPVATDNSITNFGTIFGELTGVSVAGRTTSVINHGEVASLGVGILYRGDVATIQNSGTISSVGNGIEVVGDGADISNTGLITSEGIGISDVGGVGATITNAGSIISDLEGIKISSSSLPCTVVNSGTIQSNDTAIDAAVTGNFPLLRVLNTGSIFSAGIGMELSGLGASISNENEITTLETGIVFTGDFGRILNTGVISSGNGLSGTARGISVIGESTDITNSGTIVGGIGTSGAIVTVINTGQIDGDSFLTDGDDVYDGRNGGLAGDLQLGDGNDTARMGDEDNLVDGGLGGDRIYGRDGNDDLLGNGGSDTLFGGDGNDVLRGGAANDSLRGGDGDDDLSGGNNNDTLKGGRGDDELTGGNGVDELHGGRGDDLLNGGSGADTFVFTLNAGFDVVVDFQNGTDLIDVSAFGLAGFAGLLPAILNAGGDALIDLAALGGEGLLIFEGASGQLDAADFLF